MSGRKAARKVAIVTDSTAALTPDVLAQFVSHDRGDVLKGIELVVVPLTVHGTEGDYWENIDITAHDVVSALQDGEKLTTSRPAPDRFLDEYTKLARAGVDAVLSIHISKELSGTYDAAVKAAQKSPIPVTVIDSRTTGMVLGFGIIAAAAEFTFQQRPVDQQIDRAAHSAKNVIDGTNVLFYVDTLEYLHRGGRISSVSALLGTALAVKPLLAIKDGRITLSEKVRTRGRALDRLVERTVAALHTASEETSESRQSFNLAIQHMGALKTAEKVSDLVLEQAEKQIESCIIANVGAVLGVHAGPGVVATIVSPVP